MEGQGPRPGMPLPPGLPPGPPPPGFGGVMPQAAAAADEPMTVEEQAERREAELQEKGARAAACEREGLSATAHPPLRRGAASAACSAALGTQVHATSAMGPRAPLMPRGVSADAL
jgi:hypothetical protein